MLRVERVLRRIDPLGPLVGLLGLGIFLIHGLHGVLVRDLALYAYSGQQLAHGVPPYVGVINRAGPLAHLVPGLGSTIAGWLGTDDILTQRALSTVLSALTVWVVYLVGRDLYRSRAAGLIAATSLLTLKVFMLFATAGSREKITMMLLLSLALWAVVHRRWAWVGAFVALATLTWQPAFFVGAAVALAAMAGLRGRDLLHAVGRFCLGGAIPTALAVVGFAAAGALRPFLEGFVLINLRYTEQTGLWRFLTHKQDLLQGGYGASLWVFLVGLVSCLVGAAVASRRSDRQEPHVRAQVALGVGVLVAVLWSFRAYNGWPDSLVAAPFAVLGVGGLVHRLIARAPRPPVLTAAFCVVALVLAGASAAATRSHALDVQQAEVDEVLEIAGPDATFVSIAAPAPLVLAHKTNPVRYQMFTGGFAEYVDATYPGGLEGLARHLDRLHPTFMTVDHGIAKYAWIRPTLKQDYVNIGRSADVEWYARKDLGEPELKQLVDTLEKHDLPGEG
jgi:hypothetical protein